MPTQQQIQDWLTEAYAARHKLAIGRSRVSIRQDGRALDFTAANPKALDEYIEKLEGMLTGAVRRTRFFRATQTGSGY